MDAFIHPLKNANISTVSAIPSKSYSHRAIICAALASGVSVISNVIFSQDIISTVECCKKLGAKIDIINSKVIITGIGGDFSKAEDEYYANESGSTLRFMIPILALCGREVTFVGEKRLMERPLAIYSDIFAEFGLKFALDDNKISFTGPLRENYFKIPGNISSQFISGLLFSLPLLKKESKIVVLEPFESKNYILMTIDVLNKFGIKIKLKDNEIIIPGNQSYISTPYIVEGDYSQMANFLVQGAICNTTVVTNLNPNSLQADRIILDYLRAMNVKIEEGVNSFTVYKAKPLINDYIELDLESCPDIGPILMVAACYLNKVTLIKNTKRLKYKESNRADAMKSELMKFAVDVEVKENSIIVYGKESFINELPIITHNDHRIFMAMAILSTIAASKVRINDTACLNKSYPTFLEDLEKVGVTIDYQMSVNNILIVGLGLIGGSYAKGLAKAGIIPYAIDINQDAIRYGKAMNIIKEFTGDYSAIELVILSLYPQDNILWLKENQDKLAPGCIITDVSGVKRQVVTNIQAFLRPELEFIASHPMAGREVSGVELSDEKIFYGANFIITPTEKNSKKSIQLIKELATILHFGNIETLSIDNHDKVISYLSQLTHVIAVSLMNSHQSEEMIRFTGDSFRDLTRIAKINEALWSELFLVNRDYLINDIEKFIDEMNKFKEYLKVQDKDEIMNSLRIAKAKRFLFDKN